MAEDRLLSRAEVAEKLSVSLAMVDKLRRHGELPVVHVGDLPRIPESAVSKIIGQAEAEKYVSRRRQP